MNLQIRYMCIASGISFYMIPKYNVTVDHILNELQVTDKHTYELQTGNGGGNLHVQ